ncbi:MAG: helix-turn-helix transcriptional regulator [Coriobacteriia bacterium]|nr:helix-turn-helix transcriptional regulator [Coriobacteriia bacterium]
MSARDHRNIRIRRKRETESSVQNYGDILRDARTQQGMSTYDVARNLHVREDIVVAIEEGDFSQIPPQGYSRNMIKSYARMLGLNANKITNMFLDSEYSYRIGKERKNRQKITDENKKRVPQSNIVKSRFRTPRQQIEDSQRSADRQSPRRTNTGISNREIHSFDRKYNNTPRARREYDNEQEIRRGRNTFGDDNDYDNARARLQARRQTTESPLKHREQIGRSQYQDSGSSNGFQFMNVYNAGKSGIQPQNIKLPIIIAAVTILVIILILFLFFMGRAQENAKTDVSNIQVTGLTDPDQTDKDTAKEKEKEQEVLTAPNELDVNYKVKDGASAYIEVYDATSNKPMKSQQLSSGQTGTLKLKPTERLVTTSPQNITFTTSAGVTLELVDTYNTGIYMYTYNKDEYQSQLKSKGASSNGKRQ